MALPEIASKFRSLWNSTKMHCYFLQLSHSSAAMPAAYLTTQAQEFQQFSTNLQTLPEVTTQFIVHEWAT